MNFEKEVLIRSIKILDIGYLAVIYFVLGIVLAKLYDAILGEFDANEEKKKSLLRSILEVICYLWFIGVLLYIVRNVVPLIPFPLDGVYGFKHLRLKEVTSDTLFVISFVQFQKYYQDKIKYIISR